jgi:inner membrane protein
MDSITQGILGAAAAQAVFARRLGARTWLYGAVGGMAADLDILIRGADPMIALTYHRHFTHSIAFIVPGGLLSSLPWTLRKRWASDRLAIAGACIVGYATHALLDAFTTYGTQLFWPFSRMRVAWDFVAIVDPIYTLLLLAGVIAARRRSSPRPAIAALIASSVYLALGGVLHARAITKARTVAHERGHAIGRIEAFPMIPVNFVWRTVYRAGGRAHIDYVRTPWFGATTLEPGESAAMVDLEHPPIEIAADPRTAAAWQTFAWFTDGWVGESDDAEGLHDLRYGSGTTSVESMWVLQLAPGTAEPVVLKMNRPAVGDLAATRWREITGAGSPRRGGRRRQALPACDRSRSTRRRPARAGRPHARRPR